MIKCQEDEYIAVRVQDPRIQNEGSWNSYVDFKIFLYTNSKAFTAKTSCVRRRYSEFVWLRKKLQKNAGLVPVPDLPSKSFFFSFNNEDFIEKRRKGLQYFLDRVVHMTVCLSDSQLHLFLQTQLPVSHIQDCVQGLTPYTVTDAILTYASSNVGWAQEQDAYTQEQCPTPVPYESMESPSPHMPSSQCGPPQSLTASGAAAATAGGAGAAVAAAAAAAADVSNPATDSVTVDVHDVKLVELKEDAQSKALALPSDRHVEAIVEVHTDDADLTIFDQEHAVIEGKASEEGYEDVALEAVDHVEGLLTDDGLGEEETVTEQHQVVSVEAIHEETSGKRSLLVKQSKVETEPLEVSCEDKLNVEPLPQEGSCLSSASDNDGTLSKSSVMPQSLADHESLQDGNETNARMNQNEPVEEHHGDQSQSEEEEEEVVTLFEEESSAQADVDVDEGVCVEKPEQDDATDKVFQSVQNLQSLDLCEEENKLNGVLSNGHTSDSSGMSAIEDSTEEATECMLEKNISANVIESVVSGSDEDRSVHLEDSLEACEPKDQICCDQIEQPYTDLSAQVEATEGDRHGNVSQEQVDDGLINHMEVTP